MLQSLITVRKKLEIWKVGELPSCYANYLKGKFFFFNNSDSIT